MASDTSQLLPPFRGNQTLWSSSFVFLFIVKLSLCFLSCELVRARSPTVTAHLRTWASLLSSSQRLRFLFGSMSIELIPLDDSVGVDIEVFETLWKARARVAIAETIVYKYGKLESWFFNSATKRKGSSDLRAELPQIRKKRDYTVRRGDVNQTIMEAFTSHCSTDSEIVATWISGEPNELCKVLHLTKATLHQFLKFVPEKGHGVLQRWTAPFGGRNSLIRSEWSPHHFSLDMCTNWHAVGTRRLDTLARARTRRLRCDSLIDRVHALCACYAVFLPGN